MATDRNDQGGMSRRDFTTRVGAAAAGAFVADGIFGRFANAAPHVGNRILGANDCVVVASIGIPAALFAFNEGVVVNSARVVNAWSDNDYKPIPPDRGILSNAWILSGDDLVHAGNGVEPAVEAVETAPCHVGKRGYYSERARRARPPTPAR